MGGTFDPIHHGHLVTAEEALWQFHLDEVVFVPTGQPWMKADRQVTASEHRYLMTVIATAPNPRFTVSRIEVDREGPTYTIDTLKQLREARGPEVELFFVTGADAMFEILQWKDPHAVLAEAHFIAATRARLRPGPVPGRGHAPPHVSASWTSRPWPSPRATSGAGSAKGSPSGTSCPRGSRRTSSKQDLYRSD